MQPRLLGCAIGGLIIATNARTILNALAVHGAVRAVLYVTLGTTWVAALTFTLGAPYLTRPDRTEPSSQPRVATVSEATGSDEIND